MRTARPLSRRALLGVLGLSSTLLVSCASEPGPTTNRPESQAETLLVEHGLQGLDARQIIDRLEALRLTERPSDLMAAVMPEALVLSDAEGREASLPLPAAEFYLSVAPFVETTHECFHHSLTTCLGELAEREIEVLVTSVDGEVLLDERRTTAPNGFLGLWLPRDQELTLNLAMDGAAATAPLRTDAESPTCLTTMQLSD